MAVFISYSHNDRDFADTLAAHLVKNRARVWVDRWELKVGDSIIQRIQFKKEIQDHNFELIERLLEKKKWG